MVKAESQLSRTITPDQAKSLGTPYTEFVALQSVPQQLGYAAHSRLEDVIGFPIASDSIKPEVSDEAVQQRAGDPLSARIGTEKEFTSNLPIIKASMKDIAEDRGVPEEELWSEVLTILDGSGIGHAMYRTLDKPLGGSYGGKQFIDKNGSQGITFLVRENIANWGERRHSSLMSLLGGLPVDTLANVEGIIYAGGGRPYRGAELWRPELRPFVVTDEEGQPILDDNGNETSTLVESTAASILHAPRLGALLSKLELLNATVDVVGVDDPKASGDDVVRAVAEQHGDQLKNSLIVEVGNAPAGYTQLSGALVLAHELGIDPTQQYVAVTDAVEIVHPNHFDALTLAERSKVQNAATALNSINGWLKAIVDVNKFVLESRR